MRGCLPIRFLGNCLLILPYLLSFVIPRRRDIWVFGAWFGHRYADNSRYVFDYVCKHDPRIRAVWISRERRIVEELRNAGKEAYLSGSWLGYLTCCRAAVAVLTCALEDVNVPGAARATKVQLWHGTPLKKIGLDDRITGNPDEPTALMLLKRLWRKLFPFMSDRWDLVISPSDAVSERLKTAFGLREQQIKVTGYPRGDVILDPRPAPVKVIEDLKTSRNASRIVLYLPTHRGEGRDSIDLFSGLDAGKLEECLDRRKAILLVKMHFYHRKQSAGVETPHVYWLDEHEAPDINRLLPFTNVLITDYSSVYFDYLLLDRPVLFAPFDKERYLAQDRQFYDDYDDVTPGPKCADWDEVIRELDSVLSGHDPWKQARKECLERFNRFVDVGNSKRTVDAAKETIGPQCGC